MRHIHAGKLHDLGEVHKQGVLGLVEPTAEPEPSSKIVYPYGTCIRLEDEALDKCMPGEMPPIGATVHGCFTGIVKNVTPATESIDDAGKVTKCGACVTIETRELGFAAEDDVDRQLETSETRQKTWYGGKDSDGDYDGD